MLPTTTPGKTAHQLSQEDEKLLLHVSMYKALLIRNLGNIGKEWTAEEAKDFIDNSGITKDSGLPELDVPSVSAAFKKWRSILENCFLLSFSKTVYSVGGKRVPVLKARLTDLNETAPSTPAACREAVEKCRQVFLRRAGRNVETSDHECNTLAGLRRLIEATNDIELPSPPTSSSPSIVTDAPPEKKASKPFKQMKSESRKRERAAEMIRILVEHGYFPSDACDAGEYMARELQKMGIEEEEEVDDEEVEDELPEGILSVDQLSSLSDIMLAAYCSKNVVVNEEVESIIKENVSPYSQEQSDRVLKVYDSCLTELSSSNELDSVVNPDKTIRELKTMAARATVTLLNMTTEFKSVSYEDVQRFVTNRNRRVKHKSQTGRHINDALILQNLRRQRNSQVPLSISH
jgi:hypothetical protein